MNNEEINKAFEGRWRIKGFAPEEVRALSGREVKALCRDFFEAAVTLAERSVCGCTTATTTTTTPPTPTTFDQFWNLYDKKVARPKCEKLWLKLTPAERLSCLSYIPLYKQAQPDKQFRKNPETFLRNKSWNDELIYHNNAADSQSSIQQQRLSKLVDILAD